MFHMRSDSLQATRAVTHRINRMNAKKELGRILVEPEDVEMLVEGAGSQCRESKRRILRIH